MECGRHSQPKATPVPDGHPLPPATKVRHDRIDETGAVSLRHRSKLHHIGIGRAHKGKRVLLLVCELDIRVIDEEGELLQRLTLDPSKDDQARSRYTL